MLPETGLETSLKGQIRVSEVLGRQRFNTAVSWQVQACTKRQLKAAIFKQTEDWSSGKNSLKTSKKFNFCRHYPLSIRGQISCNSYSCFLVKILTKIFLQHVKSFFAKQHSKWLTLIFLRNHVILKHFASVPCVIHIKISFHVWNLLKCKILTKLFASLCLLHIFNKKRRSRTVSALLTDDYKPMLGTS